jgi:hypothetical protein
MHRGKKKVIYKLLQSGIICFIIQGLPRSLQTILLVEMANILLGQTSLLVYTRRQVVDLDFASVFNFWAQHKKTHFYS